jgi:peptidyl-prolyl cis-trans isomerase B (cyclophilin B)
LTTSNEPKATITTTQGDITIRFFRDQAPGHVKNFLGLAASGFYDGTVFHRVIPGFMIQGGDPQTKDPKVSPSRYGTGGNTDAAGRELKIKAEFNKTSHRRGILSMARSSDPDSASSQFFIVVKDSPFLDRQYTAFGEVIEGIEVADLIVSESKPNLSDSSGGRPAVYQKIVKIGIAE